MPDFGTIRPGDIDNFAFDFSGQIGSSGKIVATPVWGIAVSTDSVYLDATPQDRLIGVPNFSDTQTAHQLGLMLDGVTYTITVIVTIDDGRVFSSVGEVECTDKVPAPGEKTLTVDQFRTDFPEFTADVFPNNTVQMYIDYIIADNNFPIHRWGPWQLYGQELYIAHNLALGNFYGGTPGTPGAGIGAGGTPGLFTGIGSSKSVNGVSISYDTNYGMAGSGDMGEYAMTLYGRRLWTMMRNAGAGPIQF